MTEAPATHNNIRTNIKGKAYFIADLHLGAPYIKDVHEAERHFIQFLDSISSDASEIYLLGDVLDYWYEYRYCVPRGFVRFFGKLASMADAGIKITWLLGNHDIWIFDYLPEELGIEVVDGPLIRNILGTSFLLAHGDGLGRTPWTFAVMRRLFRNRLCQRCFSAIHPRWTIPFAHAWSSHSRANGEAPLQTHHPLTRNLMEYSEQRVSAQPEIRFCMYGHLHIPLRKELANGGEIIILGDWLHRSTYASWDGNMLKIHSFNTQSNINN